MRPLPPEEPLSTAEVAVLREALGRSTADRVQEALEEVALQVAVEDMVILVFDGLAEAARTLLAAVLELTPRQEATLPEPTEETP